MTSLQSVPSGGTNLPLALCTYQSGCSGGERIVPGRVIGDEIDDDVHPRVVYRHPRRP